jgi:abortive infection bacteriophage resistance protein
MMKDVDQLLSRCLEQTLEIIFQFQILHFGAATYSHHHFSPDNKFSINHLQQYHSQYMAKYLHNITRSVSKAAHQIHCQTDKVETIPSEH